MPSLRSLFLFSLRLARPNSAATVVSASALRAARIRYSTEACQKYDIGFKVQPSSLFKYNMASQEDITPGSQPVQVVVAQKAMVKANARKGIKRKMNRNRTVTSTVTANGPQSQVTLKTNKKKTRKQNKAEKEAAEASSAQPATEVTETEETAEIAEITAATAATEITESTTETGLLVRDEITAPSAASGGVPEPTASYLRRAHLAPSRLSSPRRILIVMDLNGTLLHRPSKRRPSHFIARPHARIFMDYLLSTFSVAVWSSARPHNVQAMVASLLTPAQRQRCLVVWGRERMGLSSADYDARVQCYKRLARVWGDRGVMAAHPDARGGGGGGGGRWDQSNTVLVDDSAEKARSEPHNLLRIPEYLGPEAESPHVLPQVHDYINELAWQADISQYIRENPFKLDASYKL
ncbi:hypothetical protein G3M48_009543 [Beauveria asiatica]|uniref:Mitochondrial import inner membrane translocase subunit TIM50 n=1 Tax=Beauveria asiatica TaxID=1069075 RepID=A0AAW0RIW7_9HYPO